MGDKKHLTFEEMHGGATPEDCESNLKTGCCVSCPFIDCQIQRRLVERLREIFGDTKYQKIFVTPYQEGMIPKERKIWGKREGGNDSNPSGDSAK
jgi:hypothetical protein